MVEMRCNNEHEFFTKKMYKIKPRTKKPPFTRRDNVIKCIQAFGYQKNVIYGILDLKFAKSHFTCIKSFSFNCVLEVEVNLP